MKDEDADDSECCGRYGWGMSTTLKEFMCSKKGGFGNPLRRRDAHIAQSSEAE